MICAERRAVHGFRIPATSALPEAGAKDCGMHPIRALMRLRTPPVEGSHREGSRD